MVVRFSDEQVVKATGATRVRSGARASYDAISTDTRQVSAGCLFVALKGERYDAHDFIAQAADHGAAGVVVNKSHAADTWPDALAVFAVDDTLAALGGLARFHRQRFHIPLGAVTGSNGKTTTKEMIASILATRGPALKTQGNLNNEVGVPLTLFELAPSHVAAIVEMGMNHAGEIGRLTAMAQPDAGLITSVQSAHLEGLGSLEGVAKAKGELFAGLRKGATAVVNLDDPRILAQAVASGARQLTFGRHPHADICLKSVESLRFDGFRLTLTYLGRSFDVKLKLLGAHNAANATAAFALCVALGYRPEECVRGLEHVQAYARRLQVNAAPAGFTVIDDCYNANPSSMLAALETLASVADQAHAVAVLGDMLEVGAGEQHEHTQMGEKAPQHAGTIAFFGPRMKHAYAVARPRLGEKAAHFLEVAPLLAWLTPQLSKENVVLVKASRGMKLERVVEGLGVAAAGAAH
ncbi:MAG: UDP-N-acetylmuramoyl-tripeptide--D-alanyl-D-alanine ligase [Myxococcaceae bacterium]|nr:UDP-N-acetylmuramoyl-tripeptide--D-alanyl-D-alanine ligase [Myxococcaceae bacterium]